jgi:hypothetical protein
MTNNLLQSIEGKSRRKSAAAPFFNVTGPSPCFEPRSAVILSSRSEADLSSRLAWAPNFRTEPSFLEQGVPRKFILRYLGEFEEAEMRRPNSLSHPCCLAPLPQVCPSEIG